MNLIIIISIFLTGHSIADDRIDKTLRSYIQRFNLRPVSVPKGMNRPLFELGKKLFFETELSGNRNISCATCHNPKNQTVDWLPLSIGEGGEGEALERRMKKGRVLTRSTPHLFNLGRNSSEAFFWDGRVDEEAPINLREDIKGVITSTLSHQAFFPLITADEMLGLPGTNELASASDQDEVVRLLEARILQGKSQRTYKALLHQAFPQEQQFNLGHFLEAIAHFETHAFVVHNTPWDQYLRGKKNALTREQKRGAILFLGKGSCITCHDGDYLGGSGIHNTAVPTASFQFPAVIDLGRFEVSGNTLDKYAFKVPSLRNVAFTFPYMHNGVFFTLDEVVSHYSNIRTSSESDSFLMLMNSIYKKFYPTPFIKIRNEPDLIELLSPKVISRPDLFTKEERKDLVDFLRGGLSDPYWKPLN